MSEGNTQSAAVFEHDVVGRIQQDRRFYLLIAIACCVLVFAGFAPTYYVKALFPASPALSLLVHVHAFVFTVWMLYFVLQTALLTVDRPRMHRRLGILGGYLGLSMIFIGVAVAFVGYRHHRTGGAYNPETILLLGLGDLLDFAVFFLFGYFLRRDFKAHQRLMLLSVVTGLVGPAIGRLGFRGLALPFLLLIAFSFLLAGPVYDLATSRRIHHVYIYGCLFAILTAPPVRVALASTALWIRAAHVLTMP